MFCTLNRKILETDVDISEQLSVTANKYQSVTDTCAPISTSVFFNVKFLIEQLIVSTSVVSSVSMCHYLSVIIRASHRRRHLSMAEQHDVIMS